MPKERRHTRPLKPQHKLFAMLYLANGGNATAAYREVFPSKTRGVRSTENAASRLLGSDGVKAFIAGKETKALQAIEATAEEAMAAITRTLRLDPRLMLDKQPGPNYGKPLPMIDWPDDVALVVKGVKANGDVVFYDKQHAAELIAESHGKIKKKLDITLAFDHVKYLADKSRPK